MTQTRKRDLANARDPESIRKMSAPHFGASRPPSYLSPGEANIGRRNSGQLPPALIEKLYWPPMKIPENVWGSAEDCLMATKLKSLIGFAVSCGQYSVVDPRAPNQNRGF